MVSKVEPVVLFLMLSPVLPLILVWRGRRGALDPTFLWLLAPWLTYLLGGFGRMTGQAAVWDGLTQVPEDRRVEISHQALPVSMVPELAASGSLVFVFVGMILLAAGLLWFRRKQSVGDGEHEAGLLWLIASLGFFVLLAAWRFLTLQSRIWVHDAFAVVEADGRVQAVEAALQLERSLQMGALSALAAMVGLTAFLLHRARVLWPIRRTKNGVTILIMLIFAFAMADAVDRRDEAFGLDRSPEAAHSLVRYPSANPDSPAKNP